MIYAEINQRFTEAVTEYLCKGYAVNTSSMSGSQGDIAKIDLTDGNEIVRIFIRRFSNIQEGTEGVEIIVGKSTDNVKPNCIEQIHTLWNGHLEVIRTERFYRVDGNYRRHYYGTKEDAKKAAAIRYERYKRRPIMANGYIVSQQPKFLNCERSMAIAERLVRRKLGCDCIITSGIKLAKDCNGYFVSYCGKSYRLH